MKKNSITKNYLYNVAYQLLTMIIPVVTIPYLARVLGSEKIGIYSYTLSITTYFILFGTLGINKYGQREIAFVQDDIKKRSKVFREICIIKCITLLSSILLFYLFFCINGDYSLYFKLFLLEILSNVFDVSWFFQGLEEFKKTVLRNAFVKILSVICIFCLIKDSNDLYIYILIYTISNFLGNLSLWIYVPKYINKVSIRELQLKRHLKPTFSFFIPQIATQVYTVLDKTMIGAIIANKSEVGYYEQAEKIVKVLMTIATSLGTVMMPRIAATYAKGDKSKIKQYMNKSFSFIMMLSIPLSLGILSIANKFVPIFLGDGYDKVIPLLCLLCPIIVFIGLSNVTGTQYLLPTKQQNKFTISVLVGAIVNFILNIILINYFASIGAAISTVIAEFTVTLVQFILIRKEISFKNVFYSSYKYLLAGIIMFMFSVAINFVVDNYLISLILQISISFTIYFTLLLIFRDNLVMNEFNKILSKVNLNCSRKHNRKI
jgi:O-antigen/teichoic acid export membrane protein